MEKFFFFLPFFFLYPFTGANTRTKEGKKKNESEVNRVPRPLSGTSVREKQTVERERDRTAPHRMDGNEKLVEKSRQEGRGSKEKKA